MSNRFVVGEMQVNATVLAGLRQWMGGTSWTQLRHLMQSRRVSVNGSVCTLESRRLAPGDIVEILPRPAPSPPSAAEVRVVYEDREILVSEKPSGMVTARRPEERRWPIARRQVEPALDEILSGEFSSRARREAGRRQGAYKSLLAAHRIDRDTSGLVLFAKTSESLRHLQSQFAARTPVRVYWALVEGQVAAQVIRSGIGKNNASGKREVLASGEGGQEAITHIRPVTWFSAGGLAGCSLLECQLNTGRTNQIRIHLASIDRPVLGDRKYGPLLEPRDLYGCRRLALHATRLSVVHPQLGSSLEWQSPWPGDLPSVPRPVE